MIYTLKIRYFSELSLKGKVVAVMAVSLSILFVVVWSLWNGLLPKVLAEQMPEVLMEPLGLPPIGVANATKSYGIMFDAGSTGSRIHVYTFFRTKDGSLDLEGERFEQVKPGLSSYADKPTEGAESLKGMLDIAKEVIPKTQWPSTPVALKATAGLRLLPSEKSNALLKEVTNFIKSYPFFLIDEGVRIMDGTDEGLFSWVTLNFLLGRMNNMDSTHGMMDLGGGSTQITFYPTVLDTRNNMNMLKDDFKVRFHQKKEEVTLYTHSYLNLGLMAARKRIFSVDAGDNKKLSSPCLPADHKGKWEFQSISHEISGVAIVSDARFKECYSRAKALVSSSVRKEKEVNQVPFYIFSYYYDRAADAKMIDVDEGGSLSIKQFMEASKKECATPSSKEPFLCMDLSYLSALLHDGFGFYEDTLVHLKKKIKGVETAWCLGAMFNVLNQLEGKS